MKNKQIIINKYFYMMRDEIGRIFGIQEIGDTRQLIKDIREQNEYIQAKEQECEELKTLLKRKEQECEDLKAKTEYVFSDVSPNFNYFCDVCVAKDKCNQNCCFEQIKELIYEAE